ncbi:protein piccolo [Caerostris darwini]|uniref:Protein piccolo n=1 Tax=Caerostris darwini TaxID=1538125 RepID=A0AAV4WAR8_9ARAC|nr:protein piccolo [Caerostris darwini]
MIPGGGAQYDEYQEDRRPLPPPGDQQHSSSHLRKAQNAKAGQKYDFPVKRILLTRDPKDRSVSGNGLGMKVVGGKEIPGSNGMIGAYVARIYPGGVVETLGEVREGQSPNAFAFNFTLHSTP